MPRLARGIMFSTSQTCEHDIFKTSGSILMQIGISGPWGKGMKLSTLGVRKSKLRVTGGRS